MFSKEAILDHMVAELCTQKHTGRLRRQDIASCCSLTLLIQVSGVGWGGCRLQEGSHTIGLYLSAGGDNDWVRLQPINEDPQSHQTALFSHQAAGRVNCYLCLRALGEFLQSLPLSCSK